MSEPLEAPAAPRRANVIGSGLIGGSVAMGLRANEWHVTISDSDPEVAARAVEVGAGDAIGLDPDAELTVVAVPVSMIADEVKRALAGTGGYVTDVGSTKVDICHAVDDPRFVGGHPMAGSEQDGIDGARPQLFQGAMWVLTPMETTDEMAFAMVRRVVKLLGAESIALTPRAHDQMVAQVSHIPHLTAASLMVLADNTSVEHRALLRLAAGGFRDMTRISAGRPAIWPDICFSNRTAIMTGLDRLTEALTGIRNLIEVEDREGLVDMLQQARQARINLPTGFEAAESMVEIAVPVADRPGEIAAIATLASELDVNIFDLELSHSGEGRKGIMVLIVDAKFSERLLGGLLARGYRPTSRVLH